MSYPDYKVRLLFADSVLFVGQHKVMFARFHVGVSTRDDVQSQRDR